MLKIFDGRACFYQWDTDQKLSVEYAENACHVHFENPAGDTTYDVETYTLDGRLVADVPNILLQTAGKIRAWIYRCAGDECTIETTIFRVQERQKPADYVYTETEVFNYHSLVNRLDRIEEAGVSDEQIEKAVTKYLDENPINTGVNFETDETLTLENGILHVNTAEKVEQDNTLPVTSAAVFAEVGNINALLETI